MRPRTYALILLTAWTIGTLAGLSGCGNTPATPTAPPAPISTPTVDGWWLAPCQTANTPCYLLTRDSINEETGRIEDVWDIYIDGMEMTLPACEHDTQTLCVNPNPDGQGRYHAYTN